MSHRNDVAIIGAGTAGLSARGQIRAHTDNHLLINAGPYGTTCARTGCMPSKVLIETVNAYTQTKTLDRGAGLNGRRSSVKQRP
jgi:dihydrolipoamide dehydrogenase